MLWILFRVNNKVIRTTSTSSVSLLTLNALNVCCDVIKSLFNGYWAILKMLSIICFPRPSNFCWHNALAYNPFTLKTFIDEKRWNQHVSYKSIEESFGSFAKSSNCKINLSGFEFLVKNNFSWKMISTKWRFIVIWKFIDSSHTQTKHELSQCSKSFRPKSNDFRSLQNIKKFYVF